MIPNGQLTVPLEGDFGKPALAASPLRRHKHLFQVDLLCIMVAGKHIVEAQRAVLEEIIELLRHYSGSHQG